MVDRPDYWRQFFRSLIGHASKYTCSFYEMVLPYKENVQILMSSLCSFILYCLAFPIISAFLFSFSFIFVSADQYLCYWALIIFASRVYYVVIITPALSFSLSSFTYWYIDVRSSHFSRGTVQLARFHYRCYVQCFLVYVWISLGYDLRSQTRHLAHPGTTICLWYKLVNNFILQCIILNAVVNVLKGHTTKE